MVVTLPLQKSGNVPPQPFATTAARAVGGAVSLLPTLFAAEVQAVAVGQSKITAMGSTSGSSSSPNFANSPNSPQPDGITNVGQSEVIRSLALEFPYNTKFGEKVEKLRRLGYTGWRRVRGDGNCFFRAFGFGLLEAIAWAPGPLRERWAQELRRKLADVQKPLLP